MPTVAIFRDAYWAKWGAGDFYQKQDAFDAYDARLSYILNYKGATSGKVWKNWPQAIFSFNLQNSIHSYSFHFTDKALSSPNLSTLEFLPSLYDTEAMTDSSNGKSQPKMEHVRKNPDQKNEKSQSAEVIDILSNNEDAPSLWGRGHLQLYLACAIIYICSTMNGYDGSLLGSLNPLPEYQQYYGLGEGGSASTGLVFSIFQIGQMGGALFTWACD
ncbi:hypothetical protein F53441_9697 [Fusarium austroafricanum]|uniref:Major facilitator superfamily (MFS) profile domain-containing protein n=1 Tax=Fusarium austroafricanum TaxID=2364996 RepID=A0A8H4NW41_9HYPO|nr:hypothetical protein F53441_9697 [Fusarium austroafricanum]